MDYKKFLNKRVLVWLGSGPNVDVFKYGRVAKINSNGVSIVSEGHENEFVVRPFGTFSYFTLEEYFLKCGIKLFVAEGTVKQDVGEPIFCISVKNGSDFLKDDSFSVVMNYIKNGFIGEEISLYIPQAFVHEGSLKEALIDECNSI